jgi:hypothetical protein
MKKSEDNDHDSLSVRQRPVIRVVEGDRADMKA